ncbi:hypothetical protein QRD43_16715 [Pelomonas sp. APW6]|uniref:Alcohol dehydrogenase GroES-associated domain-containing protein n=1 Tax=Roseateles subflavus TaxID=3053353 RepID=A0ABT7LL13_9BURK|nr:hypothetical protein [Pelomonas sp. APW6]MDL5033559.1 hypothetical protein [Pelomonas sp. APW6]
MKALTYQGARDVRVETMPDPIRLAPDDRILRPGPASTTAPESAASPAAGG